jgi:hypothetical protein
MNNSYIKIYRELLSWEWFNDSKMVHLFLYLLLSANHTSNKWRGIDIQRGQLITGRNSITKSTGLTPMSVRTCIERLKSTNEITIKSTNKYSLITIVKYDVYQSFDKKTTNKTTNKVTNEQPANNQQTTTNNNDNNIIINKYSPLIEKWLEYKKQRKESYVSQDSINLFEKKLMEYSNNDFEKAKKIIEQSMGNNWAGIFPLKENLIVESVAVRNAKNGLI